jgi:ankyrin repeat protein
MTANEPTTMPVRPILELAMKLAFVNENDVKAALEGTEDPYNEFRTCDNQGQSCFTACETQLYIFDFFKSRETPVPFVSFKPNTQSSHPHYTTAGHTPLHLLAAYSKENYIDLLVQMAGDDAPNLIALQDNDGNTPLHLCAHYPMACYQLAAVAPAVCLVTNKAGLSPIDLARQHGGGEALNALLLACSGNSSPDVIDSMNELTKKGAVADTWAPNGQSSLMLAAAANSAEAITLLLSAGASLELQDAMGRTALMCAAGSDAVDALKVLLDAGASVALRDRRNRTACDYAEKPEAKKVLENRVKELESKATAAQEALLAELLEEEERKAASKATKKAKKKLKAKEKKGKGSTTSKSGGEDEAPLAIETTTTMDGNEAVFAEVLVEEGKRISEAEVEKVEVEETPKASSQPNMGNTTTTTTITTTVSVDPPLPSTTNTATKTPTVPFSLPIPARRPPSPEWCTVGAPKKEKPLQPQTLLTTNIPTTALKSSSVSQSHHHHNHYQHRRSPSVGSVTSVSSGTSHETDGSSGKHSGSERSVLRRVAAAGAIIGSNSTLLQPQQQFAVPRLPVPVQRQAVCTRSTSGGEEVGAAAMFGGANTYTETASPGPASVGGGIKPGSWASVAASQRSGSSNSNNGPTSAATAAFVAVAPVVSKQPPSQQQQQDFPPHTTLASAIIPQGAWASTTGTNTLTAPSGGSSVDGSHSNYCITPATTNTATTATTAPAATISTSAAAFQEAVSEEVAVLRAEIQRLKLKNAAAELAHHQELVAVLQDASQHENAAIAKATSEERLACTVRFAALLQNNGVALASAIPGLLAGAGITTASDLDLFLSNNNNCIGNGGTDTGGTSTSSSIGLNTNTPGRDVTAYPSSASKNINFSPAHMAMAQTYGNNSRAGGIGAGAATDTSPLSTSPFSYEVGEHLRGDFFGNHSAFMVPANEAHTISASSPPEGNHPSSYTDAMTAAREAEAFMAKATAASAWSPLGNGTSTGWGTSLLR